MALNAAHWEVQTGKAIRYIGPAHGVASAGYVTVLELHRWLQDFTTFLGRRWLAKPNPLCTCIKQKE